MLAKISAYTGDADSAFQWLDRSIAVQDGGSISAYFDPLLDNLHMDPRWNELTKRIGLHEI